MTPYGTFLFFIIIAILLAPTVILGLSGKRFQRLQHNCNRYFFGTYLFFKSNRSVRAYLLYHLASIINTGIYRLPKKVKQQLRFLFSRCPINTSTAVV